MLKQELDDTYLALVERHIQQLRFPQGVLLSAQLGKGNEGMKYLLCSQNSRNRKWFHRFFTSRSQIYSYTLNPRNDSGAIVLGELRDQGLASAANSTAQAAEHVESFFNVLRRELAFYIACLNLYDHVKALRCPTAFPQPAPAGMHTFSCTGLCDITLALTMKTTVVGNDILDGKALKLPDK